jgi:hypothetical protein
MSRGWTVNSIEKEKIMTEASTQEEAELSVGDLDGGGVYVGKSATTGADLHAALADEPELLTFDEAFQAAADMRKQPGRENAHIPTAKELRENLYKNRHDGHLRNTFREGGVNPYSNYRSSTPDTPYGARVQWFGEGESYYTPGERFSVRIVW